jgi:enoyl-CoA hydratase
MTLCITRTNDVNEKSHDGVLTVTVNRPEKRNPLSLGVLERLREIFSGQAYNPSLRLAIVTGAGDRAFASGGDIVELSAVRSPEDAKALSEHGRRALDAIRRFPVPVIARLNGIALGGGAELAVACDLRFAAAGASIGFIHSRLGISPPWGGGVDLMRLVGYSTGLRLLAKEEVLTADAAQRCGLIDGFATADQNFDVAFDEFLGKMKQHPPQVMRAIKALSYRERVCDRAALDESETNHFIEVWTHEDHWNALAAVSAREGSK